MGRQRGSWKDVDLGRSLVLQESRSISAHRHAGATSHDFAGALFGDLPLQLNDLKKVNFVFAPNGAGKSTISNMLNQQPSDPTERATWNVAPTALPIRVFNDAYRSRVLTEYVDGIFTIGDNSRDVNDQIKALDEENRGRIENRDEWRNAIGSKSDMENADSLLGQIESSRVTARNSIFSAHKNLNALIIPIVFEGYRGDRDKFLDEADRRFDELGSLQPSVSWDSIERRARTLSGDKKSRSRLPEIATVSLISADDVAEVGNKSSHRGGGEFTKLIQRLNNQDWVSEGREYIHAAEGKCPFCQNQAPANLEEDLAQYFEGGFDEALRRSTEIETATKSSAARLEEELSALEDEVKNDPNIDGQSFTSSISRVRVAAKLLLSRMRERSEHPTRAVEVADIDQSVTELVELIEAENDEVQRHNQLVANVGVERRKLIDDGWSVFLSDTVVSNEIKKFKGIDSRKRSRIAGLEAEIAASEQAEKVANQKIIELRNSISNTVEVAERINKLLASMGFHRFHLKVADEASGGYRIVREDGTSAYESLSEGEKSFISFAYYWESLFGTAEANGTPEDVVSVIDDPISSLDSDALFMVAAYIRDAANQAITGNSNLRQLVVFTHNTQFHHEAAYSGDRGSKDRRYFRLVKNLNGVTTVSDDGNRSKIRGSYALLWLSIVESARNEDESNLVQIGVFNIVRRILEGYFKTVGNLKDFDQPSGVSPADARTVFQFHIWANSGSHTIADDVDQTIEVGRTKHFLRLFKEYFDIQGHEAHFDMMVAASEGEDLLKPGQLFARS